MQCKSIAFCTESSGTTSDQLQQQIKDNVSLCPASVWSNMGTAQNRRAGASLCDHGCQPRAAGHKLT